MVSRRRKRRREILIGHSHFYRGETSRPGLSGVNLRDRRHLGRSVRFQFYQDYLDSRITCGGCGSSKL